MQENESRSRLRSILDGHLADTAICCGNFTIHAVMYEMERMKKNSRRIIAALQIIGAVSLALNSIRELYVVPETHNLFSLILYAAFFCISAASFYYGLALWNGKPGAINPCRWIWLIQIPCVISKPISYSMVLGAGFIPLLKVTQTVSLVEFNFKIFEQHIFYLFGQPNFFAIGPNVIAIWVLYVLMQTEPAVSQDIKIPV